MGRAGGGGGGHHSSGGHHSGGHSSSSHRVSASRAGGSMSHSSSFGGMSHAGSHVHHTTYVGPMRTHTTYGTPMYDYVPVRRRRSPLERFFSTVVVLGIWFLLLIFIMSHQTSSIPASTVNREKITTGVAFQNDCIIDELGWFDNIPSTERQLQAFYQDTGIQPYIVLKNYMGELTDEEKEEYADQWYIDNIDNESTLLFMYFAEKNTDVDVGYMVLINGTQITTVMDAEAIEIFWAYIDYYWYTDLSTDDMFVQVFNKTATRIMDKSTTGADVALAGIILLIVVVVVVAIIGIIILRRKHEKERNEEAAAILNAPLEKAGDPTLEKYSNNSNIEE